MIRLKNPRVLRGQPSGPVPAGTQDAAGTKGRRTHGIRATTILLLAALLVGLGLIVYPSFSDWWNSFHQSRAIMNYSETVANLNDEDYGRILSAARDYNARWAAQGISYQLTDQQKADYLSQLDPGGTGIMCYIDIPSIDCHLPVYHGTDEAVLQVAVGHLDWTSLPVGGLGSHTVLSGHRGLPSARLFTDIDRMVVGDLFRLNVLDETLTYEVDQILIVLPEDISALLPEADQDLCTLVTCTPYGINTHRLLVRGHRVPNEIFQDPARVTADSVQVEPVLVAPAVGVPLLIIMLAVQMTGDKRSKRNGDWEEDWEDWTNGDPWLPPGGSGKH